MAKSVLIIDDEVAIHKSFAFVLKKYKLEVLHATSGIKAAKILKENTPDLIFMDFRLPGPNGIQITKKIKSNKRLKEIPVIGITGYASEENKKIALENGVNKILEKPFDLVEIYKTLADYGLEKD